MPTREELHALVDTLPEEAMRAAHHALSHFQTWPPAAPPDAEAMRKRMEERRLEIMQRQKRGTIAGFAGSVDYDPVLCKNSIPPPMSGRRGAIHPNAARTLRLE